MTLWFLLHWKWVLLALLVILAALIFTVPAAWRFLIRYRLPIGIAVVLFASHGAVAVATHRWFDATARLEAIERERDEARLQVKVLAADVEAAEAQRTAMEERARRAEELADELEASDRICFDEPDADRLRRLFE